MKTFHFSPAEKRGASLSRTEVEMFGRKSEVETIVTRESTHSTRFFWERWNVFTFFCLTRAKYKFPQRAECVSSQTKSSDDEQIQKVDKKRDFAGSWKLTLDTQQFRCELNCVKLTRPKSLRFITTLKMSFVLQDNCRWSANCSSQHPQFSLFVSDDKSSSASSHIPDALFPLAQVHISTSVARFSRRQRRAPSRELCGVVNRGINEIYVEKLLLNFWGDLSSRLHPLSLIKQIVFWLLCLSDHSHFLSFSSLSEFFGFCVTFLPLPMVFCSCRLTFIWDCSESGGVGRCWPEKGHQAQSEIEIMNGCARATLICCWARTEEERRERESVVVLNKLPPPVT